jgi:glycosyltransferase involved in cell wall biosynthesis
MVIVVDDGSSDQTADQAVEAGALLVRHEVNKGKGVALNTGFAFARERGCEAVVTLDADGQHDPAEIPKFIEAYERTGIPVLVGNRMADTREMPRIRFWTNRYMSWHLSKVIRQYVPDTQCGYRLYKLDIIPFVSATAERFAAESEILIRIGERNIRIDSVRIRTIYLEGKSKINPVVDTVRFYRMLWRHWRKKVRIVR